MGIASSLRDNSLAKMRADIFAQWGSLALSVSETKAENMCLLTKGTDRGLSLSAKPIGCPKKRPRVYTFERLYPRTMTILPRSTGACYCLTHALDGMA